MVRPKQKPIALLSPLISKFTGPGSMVTDPFLRTGATAKDCLVLPKHQTLMECDSDSDFVSKMRPSLLRVFAVQGLSSLTDIFKSEEVQTAAYGYFEMSFLKMEAQRKSVWKAPPALPPIQSFPDYISFFICEYHMDMLLFEKRRHLPCTLWLAQWFWLFLHTTILGRRNDWILRRKSGVHQCGYIFSSKRGIRQVKNGCNCTLLQETRYSVRHRSRKLSWICLQRVNRPSQILLLAIYKRATFPRRPIDIVVR